MSIVVLTDIIAMLRTPGIFSTVLNEGGPIAGKLAHFLSISPLKNRTFATKNLSPPVFNLGAKKLYFVKKLVDYKRMLSCFTYEFFFWKKTVNKFPKFYFKRRKKTKRTFILCVVLNIIKSSILFYM